MPSKSQSSTSTILACGEPNYGTITTTSSQLANLTSTVDTYLSYDGTNNLLIGGTPIATTAPLTFTTGINTLYNGYSSPNDGEIYIDSKTTQAYIYLSEYCEWVECDIRKVKKIKFKSGKTKNIVSVSFNFSVTRMKSKRNERKVFFEKTPKEPILLYSNYINIEHILGGYNNTAIGTTTLGNIYVNNNGNYNFNNNMLLNNSTDTITLNNLTF